MPQNKEQLFPRTALTGTVVLMEFVVLLLLILMDQGSYLRLEASSHDSRSFSFPATLA
jgi:hypothetical protein